MTYPRLIRNLKLHLHIYYLIFDLPVLLFKFVISFLFCSRNLLPASASKSILVVETGLLGDCIILLNSLIEYKHLYPSHRISIICDERFESLFRQFTFFNRIITFRRTCFICNPFYRAYFLLIAAPVTSHCVINTSRARDYAISDSITLSVRSQVSSCVIGDYTRYLPFLQSAVNIFYREHISLPHSYSDPEQHLLFTHSKLFGISANPHNRPSLSQFLVSSSTDTFLSLSPYILVAPYASDSRRELPLENYILIIEEILSSSSFNIVLTGLKDYRSYGSNICSHFYKQKGRISNLIGHTKVSDMIPLMLNCSACISLDSSAGHLAYLARKPFLIILGGGDFGLFYPYPSESTLPDQQFYAFNNMNCNNCRWSCSRQSFLSSSIFPCLESISYSTILQTARQLLSSLDR